jgi:hypothetical protein
MIKGLVNKEQIQELIYPLQVLNTIVDSAQILMTNIF